MVVGFLAIELTSIGSKIFDNSIFVSFLQELDHQVLNHSHRRTEVDHDCIFMTELDSIEASDLSAPLDMDYLAKQVISLVEAIDKTTQAMIV